MICFLCEVPHSDIGWVWRGIKATAHSFLFRHTHHTKGRSEQFASFEVPLPNPHFIFASTRPDSTRLNSTHIPMLASASRSRSTLVAAVASCRTMRAQPCTGTTTTRISARLFTTQPPTSESTTEQKNLPLSPYGGRFGVLEQPMSTKSLALNQANSKRSPFSKAKEGVKSKMHDWTDEKRNLEKRKEL